MNSFDLIWIFSYEMVFITNIKFLWVLVDARPIENFKCGCLAKSEYGASQGVPWGSFGALCCKNSTSFCHGYVHLKWGRWALWWLCGVGCARGRTSHHGPSGRCYGHPGVQTDPSDRRGAALVAVWTRINFSNACVSPEHPKSPLSRQAEKIYTRMRRPGAIKTTQAV